MALHPRMTRPGLRITLEAMEAHLDKLTGEGKQIAQDVIRELRHQLDSANTDNRRRAAVKHGDADQAGS